MNPFTVALAALLLLEGCFPPSSPPADVVRATARAGEEKAAYAAAVAELTEDWFVRDTVPRLSVGGPQAVVWSEPPPPSLAAVTVTATPIRAEDQSWNTWPDGTARLFNDALGYLWHVRLESSVGVRWDPSRTQLAVNDSEQVYVPIAAPDELLGHLQRGARLEVRAGVPPNLSLRLRNADEFRRAYLSLEAGTVVEGVVLFPAPARTLQVVAMEVRIAVIVAGEGVREARVLFE